MIAPSAGWSLDKNRLGLNRVAVILFRQAPLARLRSRNYHSAFAVAASGAKHIADCSGDNHFEQTDRRYRRSSRERTEATRIGALGRHRRAHGRIDDGRPGAM
jgi:hypothetical protein